MFEFINMTSTYESRKIDRYENEDAHVTVSTATINDSPAYAETAVCHPDYNDGKWIIVENHADRKSAQKAHNNWVKTITTKPLPNKLVDVSRCEVRELLDTFTHNDEDWVYYRKGKQVRKLIVNEE